MYIYAGRMESTFSPFILHDRTVQTEEGVKGVWETMIMLGNKVCELKGKVTGRRVIPHHEGMIKMEISTEQTGTVLGVEVMDMTTYEAVMKPGGILWGMGQGATMGKGGEMGMYHASGIGKMMGMKSSFRGVLYFMSQSPKWMPLNGIPLVYEYEADENGNIHIQAWEWK